MAQKTGNEETEFKSVPETLTLCINNCGVTANPATNNMCQNCFNSVKFTRSIKSPARNSTEIRRKVEFFDQKPIVASVKREVNRCSGCKKKVGLTGFRCRCGDMFCADHRYSDRHDCSFDYKEVGRQMIARENPVVKAAKIVRI